MRDNCSFRSISSFSEAAPQTIEAPHRACVPAAILAAPHADPDAKRGKRNALFTAEWAARPSTAQMRVCTEARRHCIPNLRVRLIAIEPHEYPAWLAIAGRYRQDGLDEVGVMAGRRRGDDFGRHIQQGCGLRDEDGEAVTREHDAILSPSPRDERRAPHLCRLAELPRVMAHARASRFTIDEQAEVPAETVCPDFAYRHAQPVLFVGSKGEHVFTFERWTSPKRALQSRHRKRGAYHARAQAILRLCKESGPHRQLGPT